MQRHFVHVLLLAGIALGGATGAAGQTVASPWVDHEHAKSRLVAAQSGGKLVAFVEIAMPEGWKTYWRNPGDAGGLPPTFDFAASGNLSGARVLYPAPKRLTDRAGDTIGYKGTALFPVEIEATAADKPVSLRLRAHFGVCREICVPLEANHELTVAPGITGEAEGTLRDALAQVPKAMSGDNSGLPTVSRAEVSSYEAPAGIVITASFPGGAAGADIFIEAPEGLYVPMPKRSAGSGDGTVTFTSSFSSPAELKSILGKPLKVTLVGDGSASEAVVTIE